MASLNKIDLSGLFERRIQFLCLAIFLMASSILMLIYQIPLILNSQAPLDDKATAIVTKIITKESGNYPVYTYQEHSQTSLIPNSQAVIHQKISIRISRKHPEKFLSEFEKQHIPALLKKRLIVIGLFVLLAAINFILFLRASP